MRVFISSSGKRSRQLAQELRSWIPYVIHPIRTEDIWFSESDIEPGRPWARDLGNILDDTKIGLICLTHENRNSPWIHFEAGALAKHFDRAKVIPVLYGMQPEDLAASPLAQFQAVQLVKDDIFKMLLSLNSELGEARIAKDVLERSLLHNWPDLEARLQKLENITIEDIDVLPGVIQVFSNRGLPEPHPGRIVHFEEGFESHTLFNILCESSVRRLLIFGRKNRKLFDKEHRDFFDSLPDRVANGFDFRCLFLSPVSTDAILRTAHADDDLPGQLQISIERATSTFKQRQLSPDEHLRFYDCHRSLNLIIADDAVLFATVELAANGRPKPLTKSGFSVVDCRLSLGRHLLKTFGEGWENAIPLSSLPAPPSTRLRS